MKQIYIFDIENSAFIKNGESVECHWVNSEADLTEIYKDKEVIFTEVLFQNPIIENRQLREMTIEELKFSKKIQLSEGEKISEGKLITVPQPSKCHVWNFEKEEWEFSVELRKVEIIVELESIDTQTIRPLRSILSGLGTDDDKDKLAKLETMAKALRTELSTL